MNDDKVNGGDGGSGIENNKDRNSEEKSPKKRKLIQTTLGPNLQINKKPKKVEVVVVRKEESDEEKSSDTDIEDFDLEGIFATFATPKREMRSAVLKTLGKQEALVYKLLILVQTYS